MTDFWSILGIEPTKDKSKVKQAYAKELKLKSIEEDPQRFQILREAYEGALEFAESKQSQNVMPPESQQVEILPEIQPYESACQYTTELFEILKSQGEKAAIDFFKSKTDSKNISDIRFLENFETVLYHKLHRWDEKKPNDLFYTISKYFGWIRQDPAPSGAGSRINQTNASMGSTVPYGFLIVLFFILARACS